MSRGVAGGPDSLVRLRADLARLGGQVQQLQGAVVAAAELADQLNPPGGPATGPPEVATWVDIEPDQAPAVLVELARWIAAVLGYHRVADHLHPCWYRHPGLVQVLLDVRAAWLAAYRDPAGGRVPAALDWWQRHLPHLERQARELLGGCSSARHEPAGPPRVGSEPVLRGYARWWAADRNPATEPPPAPTAVPRPREAPGSPLTDRPADRPASEPGAA